MKKRIILGIVICIILSSCLIVNAANNTASLQLEKKDKIVTVTLKLPEIKDGLDALAGKIEYDKSKLEFVDVKRVDSKWQEPSYSDKSGKFTLLIKSETIKETNDAIKFTFKIKENVTGKTTVTMSELTGATSKDEKITLENVKATVEINNDSTDGGNEDNNNIINGGNSENENNNNIINGGNSENENNNNIINGGNSENENNNNIIDTGNSNNGYNNTTNGKNNNIDNMAQGRLPNAGRSLIGYSIIAIIAILIVVSIVLLIKQKMMK